MPLQTITPNNDWLTDILVRASKQASKQWIATRPGMAWVKQRWTEPETRRKNDAAVASQ
ncbi:hypothetical protein [Candidatus Accumulibacter sp. ACC007]|uniref:hypothetical protein n=1 Tax=Candidatus Accumulibacter sp. ACC007 TaxID=2823333 RepID=UPI0025BD3583|nr:hypothetical protein [Candidatus Accumulibacter sp. ACC007]